MKISFGEKLKNLFSSHKTQISEKFFEDLTDAMIEGDIGAKSAFQISEELEKICKSKKIETEEEVKSELKELLLKDVKSVELKFDSSKVNIFMILGVNGVGKTTSVAKLGKYFSGKGESVILAAADTFRAASEEQLEFHGERIGVRVVAHQHGSDPSAVVFDAADACRANGGGLVLADTAGRLHNKENLVRELQKIDRICTQKADEGCYKKILVVDATTGQNALRQAEVFHEAVGLDAVIMTKYDSTAKGGIAVCLGRELNLPLAFVCTGEGYENIEVFDAKKYIDEFVG